MKKLNLILDEKDRLSISSESDLTGSETLGLVLDALEGILTSFVKNLDDKAQNELHDYVTYAVTSILGRVFPDKEEFTLTDAAVYMAQDQLLQRSMNEGIPIEDLIAEYNKKAEEHVEASKQGVYQEN